MLYQNVKHLDPDQARCSDRPDLGPIFLKRSANDKICRRQAKSENMYMYP